MKRLVKIKEIKFEQKFYPRFKYNWQVAYDYSQSMKAGANFPPITIALYKKKYYLIDGKHRIEAFKICKEEYIQAEILKNLSANEIYIEAIKKNINHGYAFSPKEKRDIVLRLQDMRYDAVAISDLVRIPVGKLNPFVADRLVRDISGEVVVKSPLKHLAGGSFDFDVGNTQNIFNAKSQLHLLGQIINILDNGLMDLEDPKTLKLWKELRKKMRALKL